MSDWTEETLASLRAARFTPRAWLAFLSASFRRARELRTTYPRAHRTLLAVAAGGAAVWLALGIAGEQRLAAVAAPWWLAACLMADWHLGMLDRRDRFGAANTLTLLRAGTVPAILLLGRHPAGLALFAAAGASDVLDGFVARSRGETTRLGLWLDGSVDGLVLTAAALVALPAWAGALVISRHLLPWAVIGASYFLRAQRPPLQGFVSGRIPGLVTFTGLALALLGVAGAEYLAAAGAVGGLGTFTAGALRTRAYALQ